MTKFKRGVNVLVSCRCCGLQTHASIDGNRDINLCRVCYESAGAANAHDDGDHTPSECARVGCPVARGVACMHESRAPGLK